MSPDLNSLCQALEAAFFVSDDPRLVESWRELHSLDLTSGLSAEVSGIRNTRILALWEAWGLPTASVAALVLAPLALAIWADRKVDSHERRVMLSALQDTIFFGTIVQDIVNAWLERTPGDDLLAAWENLIGALHQLTPPVDRKLLAEEILKMPKTLSHRGSKEKAVLEHLTQAFGLSLTGTP
jgi:hypothetical protein